MGRREGGRGGGGGYFRRQVRGRRGVCGGGGREVGEVGGGAAYRAQGLDRARAGRARRDGDRGFRARAFPPPRDATRSDGAGGGRARRAEDRVAAAGTRGSARIVYGRMPRARERRVREGGEAKATPERRTADARRTIQRAAADGGGAIWPTGRSIVDRPSIRPTVSFERAPARDRRFTLERPGDPIKPAREIARSPRRSAGCRSRDASDSPLRLENGRRARFYPSRGHAPSQNQDRAASRARTPVAMALRQFARQTAPMMGLRTYAPAAFARGYSTGAPPPRARPRSPRRAPPRTKLANTLAPAVRPPRRGGGGPRAVERAPRSRSDSPDRHPPRAPSARLPPPRAAPPPGSTSSRAASLTFPPPSPPSPSASAPRPPRRSSRGSSHAVSRVGQGRGRRRHDRHHGPRAGRARRRGVRRAPRGGQLGRRQVHLRRRRVRQGGVGCLLPVSGEVVEINEALGDAPGKVNEGAYTEGWMMKVKMSDPSEVDALMDAAAYEASCDQ